MGITQKYAHTRVFTDSSFTFIVDKQYKVLKFFQLWQEFIASGGEVSRDKKAYYNRMIFPDNYKCSQMGITKFDKDHFQKVDYTFINAFPTNIVPSAVDYANNRILEVTITFSYDRYVLGSISSLDAKSDQRTLPNYVPDIDLSFDYKFNPGDFEYSSKPRGDGATSGKVDSDLPPSSGGAIRLDVIPYQGS